MNSESINEKALLLIGDYPSIDDRRVERLLEFFGVRYETRKATDFRLPATSQDATNSKCRLVCAAEIFGHMIEQVETASVESDGFAQQIHSVFLYPTGNAHDLANIVTRLSGGKVKTCKGARSDIQWHIADDPEGICGAMRGVRAHPLPATVEGRDFLGLNGSPSIPLVSTGTKAAFLKVTWRTVPVFITSARLIDIGAKLTTPNFDVRDHLFSSVPVVSYLRWAFPTTSWNAPEANACLVIDDPLLRSRYGFVRFRELLSLMRQLRFSTSIAFIPWNWRRNNPKVVQLFKDNPDYYSLCVHGCDHTAGEFATGDRLRLRSVASEAIRRMSLHEHRTGLAHERVMVFPQGMFSQEAILELKRAGFDAIVNTEVHSNPPRERELTISDVWDVAIMSYDDFPIYTRRYPAQGIENFAFDLLLGKPCLVVIHHDFCSDGYARLGRLIDQLNALKIPLAWRRLGEVLRRSYRQKAVSPDSVAIQMYGNELLIQNRSHQATSYLIRRRERDSAGIESIYAGSHRLQWDATGGHIEFKVDLESGKSTLVKLCFKATQDETRSHQSLAYAVKTMVRRYLSEARDNYLMPAKARMPGFSRS
jgi:hypothetical protein